MQLESYHNTIIMLSECYQSAIRMLPGCYEISLYFTELLLFKCLYLQPLYSPNRNVKYFFMKSSLIRHKRNFTFLRSLPITLLKQSLSHFFLFPLLLFLSPPLESHNLPAVNKYVVLLFVVIISCFPSTLLLLVRI